jgi:hypothetical protein
MMKIDFLDEPELEFAGEGRHIDMRFGLTRYGPLDLGSDGRPTRIKVGLVGSAQTVERCRDWIERCRDEIPAAETKQPHLRPRFPGYNADVAFRSTLVMTDQLTREIPRSRLDALQSMPATGGAVSAAVELLDEELRYLVEMASPQVVLLALPPELLQATEPPERPRRGQPDDEPEYEEEEEDARRGPVDLHHMLKVRAMAAGTPIQLLRPGTIGIPETRLRRRRGATPRTLQDEATRAWNLHSALYYKANGLPWRLARDSRERDACYVGVAFYRSLGGPALDTSVAQVFNERGEGVIVRGGAAKVDRDGDRSPHLSGQDAFTLLKEALDRYRLTHGNMPARVVIHKSSRFSAEETDGFVRAGRERGIDSFDLVSVPPRMTTRLFRSAEYPPLRGTFLSMDDRAHILYTRGGVEFFETYPGMYIPRPLYLRCDYTEKTPRSLATEALGLTKMNWNDTQFDGHYPITLAAAHRVRAILRCVGPRDRMEAAYRFYM